MTTDGPKVVVVVINYESADYVRSCVESILRQSYKNIDVIFVDNKSDEKEGLEFMHENYDGNPRVSIIANTVNKGYAKAANQGIRMAIGRGAKYVSITNPDLIYTSKYFERIIARMEQDEKIAAATGKIYKYDFNNNKETDIIDSVGLFAYRNRRIVDDAQGLVDEGQFDEEREVFGVSGACPVYRTEALEDVKIEHEYFDEDFFMYKEDTDLSWRLLLYGWKNLYYPQAVAYHGRGTSAVPRFSTKEIISNRKKLSKFQKKYAFRNQNLMQFKNELWGNFFRDFGPIMLRKTMIFPYMIFFEPYLIPSYFDYWKNLPSAMRKRRHIMKNKRVSSKEMKKWFKKKSDYLGQ